MEYLQNSNDLLDKLSEHHELKSEYLRDAQTVKPKRMIWLPFFSFGPDVLSPNQSN